MIKQDSRQAVTFWAGTRARFKALKNNNGLTKGRAYFVGDSTSQADGFSDSERGEVYVATSANTAVRFGSIDDINDIQSAIDEIQESIDGITEEITNIQTDLSAKSEIREYNSASYFPATGSALNLYVDKSTGATYRWDGTAYQVVGGYTAGYGITIDGSEISTTYITDSELDDICV